MVLLKCQRSLIQLLHSLFQIWVTPWALAQSPEQRSLLLNNVVKTFSDLLNFLADCMN